MTCKSFVALFQAFFGAVLLFFSNAISALEPMTYIYHPPESEQDLRYLYHWEILKTALEKTTAKFGPFEMRPSEFMTESRQAQELKSASGKLTVMYLSTTKDFERNLIPIHIPVDKNLGGYCLFLIRKERKDEFNPLLSLTHVLLVSKEFPRAKISPPS